MTMKRRTAARALAATVCAGTMGAGMVGAPSPASAQVPTDHKVLAGNFYAGPRDEFFLYTPGAGPDELHTITKASGQPRFNLVGSFSVDGTYTPLVGDFDGDNFDEIIWYAAGSAPDYVWNFTSYGSVDSRTISVNGVYARPTVGDYTGDGADDILWYNPGFGADFFWEFNPGGDSTSRRLDSNGDYLPVSGSIGNDPTDDIFWYAPGVAADWLWDFTPGSTALEGIRQTVNGTAYRPFSIDTFADGRGNEDLFWYAPGPAEDFQWDFFFGMRFDFALPRQGAVNGHYLTAVGDYFGDGSEDVVFHGTTDVVLRENERTERGPRATEWVFPVPSPASSSGEDGVLSGVTPERVETSGSSAPTR
jgi:hypothetical protein